MSSDEPVHLNNHHRDTLNAILNHPVSHNIRWQDVVSLLGAVGTIEEKHDGKFDVQVGDGRIVITRPKHTDIGEQEVIDLRKLLHAAGFTPDSKGKEI